MESAVWLRRFRLEQSSNSRPLDQWASAQPTELLGPLTVAYAFRCVTKDKYILRTVIFYNHMREVKRVKPLRNPGRDISFPIFTRKEIETKRMRKEIKTIISRLNDFLSFLSNI